MTWFLRGIVSNPLLRRRTDGATFYHQRAVLSHLHRAALKGREEDAQAVTTIKISGKEPVKRFVDQLVAVATANFHHRCDVECPWMLKWMRCHNSRRLAATQPVLA